MFRVACQQCFGRGVCEAAGTQQRMVGAMEDVELGGGPAGGRPVPPLSTPVESYLDKPFLDQTSPRLKQDVPLTGHGHGPAPKPRSFVPVEGAVILEVVTRHKVIGPKGRDFGATVQVVVPGRIDKTVALMDVPGTQAGAVANMLADTIAAMAFENDLMVPEGTQQQGIGQGYPLDPNNILGGFGSIGGPLGGGEFSPFNQFFGIPPEAAALFVNADFVKGFSLSEEAYHTGNWQPVKDAIAESLNKMPEGKREAFRPIAEAIMNSVEKLFPKKAAETPAQEGTPSAVFPDDTDPPAPPAAVLDAATPPAST